MFQTIDGLEEILNSEGLVLRLLKKIESEPDEYKLYLECGCREKHESVICKTNPEIVMLYLNGRLRTEELFLIRSDEEFLVKSENGYEKRMYSPDFKSNYIDDLKYGDFFYTELSADLKSRQDILTVLRILERF
jgi:hypothetical protein